MKLKKVLSAVILCSLLANNSIVAFAETPNSAAPEEAVDVSAAEIIEKAGLTNQKNLLHSSEAVEDTDDEAAEGDEADAEAVEAIDALGEDAEEEAEFVNPDINPVEPLADTNFIEYTAMGKTADGKEIPYTLTINYDYKLGSEVCGQIHTVSKTEVCDMVIPSIVTVSIDGQAKDVIIRSVQRSAFEKCKATSIVLPDTVKEIGEYAFASCSNLKSVDIKSSTDKYYTTYTDENGNLCPGDEYSEPISATSEKLKYTYFTAQIGNYAFSDCPVLKDVTIAGYQKLGDYVFANCTSLENVNFNFENLYSINTSTGEKKTTLITTNSIGKYFFQNCTALKTITLPEGLYTVGNTGLFENCSALTDVYIGTTVKSGVTLVDFNGCTSLKAFHVTGENANLDAKNENDNIWNQKYMSLNGALYEISVGTIKEDDGTMRLNSDGNTGKFFCYNKLLIYPVEKTDTVYNAPDTLLEINANVFKDNKYIKNVVIDTLMFKDGVKIGANAFQNCKTLQTISIDNYCTIGDYAFEGCSALRDLTHTSPRGSIGSYSFKGCALENTELYGWNMGIGQYAFAENNCLTSMTLGPTVGTLKTGVFSNCASLKSVDLKYWAQACESTSTFGTNMFEKCTALEKAITPDCLLELSSYTFLDCTQLKDVTLGIEHAYIASGAFKGCTSLAEMTSNRYLVRLAPSAFDGCTALKKFTFTRTLKNIEDKAFNGCTSLAEICAPADSYASEYAKANGIKFTQVANDIVDSEFFFYDMAALPADADICLYDENAVIEISGKYYIVYVSGYRGGFDRLTFKYASTPYIGEKFITNPASKYGSMQSYIKGVDFSNIRSIGCSWSTTQSSSAFSGCKNLTTTVFYDTLTFIGKSTFFNCTSLASTKPWTMSDDRIGESGVLNTLDEIETYTLPESCKTICSSAFSGDVALRNVELPLANKAAEAVGAIGDSAFSGCTNLNAIVLGDNISSIGKSAFSKCTSLAAVELPAALSILQENTFANCTALAKVKFNERLEFINANAFLNCTALTVLTFNNNLFFEADGFKGCKNINMLVIPNSDNITTVRDPFPDTASCLVCCAKPEEGVESKVEPYAIEKGYEIKNVDLVYGLNYALIKVYVTIPENLTVTKADGTVLKTGDYVVMDDELTIKAAANADGLTPIVKLNDVSIDYDTEANSGSYTVKESDLELVFGLDYEDTSTKYGDADGDSFITASDSALILQKALDSTFTMPVESKADYKKVCDVDNDGQVTASDSAIVLQKAIDNSFKMVVEK